MKPYTEELIFIDAEDGVGLDGALIRPTTGTPTTAIVWIHGNTGQFHSMSYILIGRVLAERGYLFVTGDTRGHDVVAQNFNVKTFEMVAGGSAWERFEEAPLDVNAWIEAAVKEGVERIILVGHSQGAGKITYTQAQRPDGRVKGMVLASPDLHGQNKHWKPELVEAARKLVTDGHPNDLMPPLFNAEWYRLTAANVVSRAEVLSHVYTSDRGAPSIAAITCPILALFGSDGDIGGEAELATLRQQAVSAPRFEGCMVGGDHMYTDHEAEVGKVIGEWIAGLGV